MGKVVSIVSGNGGVGKSTFAVNAGCLLASRGYKTLLLDLNFSSRSLDLYTGTQNLALYNVYDILSGLCKVEDAVIRTGFSKNLLLIPAMQNLDGVDIDKEKLDAFIDDVSERYEFVFIDCMAGYNGIVEAVTAKSDETVMVTTPDYVAVRDVEMLEDNLIRNGVANRSYVLNKMISVLLEKKIEPDIDYVTSHIKSELLGMIPNDFNIRMSANIGVPIVIKADTYIAENFHKIVDRLLTRIG